MPVYNAGQYLAQAIDSILNQTFRDWELILINDGSTDNSEEIILRYEQYEDSRIYYYKNPENKGLIYTRNLLIEKADGKYIAFLDSDDFSMPGRLKAQTAFLDNNPGYALCGTWATMVDGENKFLRKINMPQDDESIRCSLLFISTFVQSGIMIRREVLEQNPYDSNFPLAEDYELWCRLSRLYKLKNIPEHLTRYRWHGDNISQSRKKHLDDLVKNIYRRELSLIGIDATEEELTLHSSIRDKSIAPLPVETLLRELKTWLRKLAAAALDSKRYDKNTLLATIAFRWIFACKERKKYGKILSFPVKMNAGAYKILFKMLYERI